MSAKLLLETVRRDSTFERLPEIIQTCSADFEKVYEEKHVSGLILNNEKNKIRSDFLIINSS